MPAKPKNPFGEESCEAELNTLQHSYSDYYFTHTLFTEKALDPSTYLFVGRKGAGKTSLAHYFTFQNTGGEYECIDVDEPLVYRNVLREITDDLSRGLPIDVSAVAMLWNYIIWMLIFERLQSYDVAIQAAVPIEGKSSSRLIHTLLKDLSTRAEDDEDVLFTLEDRVVAPKFQSAQKSVLGVTEKKPIYVAIDSLEENPTNEAMMATLAGLIQCASDFNQQHAHHGIHVKVFIAAEVYPHLVEQHIPNLLKYVRKLLPLQWRPKHLIRLICWRLYSYLRATDDLLPASKAEIDWDDPRDVINKMWTPYFGRTVFNSAGVEERTLPYILRHTQLRPRQMILLCNSIAEIAQRDRTFPRFLPAAVVEGIKAQETQLAMEVLNSYKEVYPKVANIVSALNTLPMRFEGRLLDKVANYTASEWVRGEYTLFAFRQLVAELGIVGCVRHFDARGRICTADFEYFMPTRLNIQPTNDCVIHPMFFSMLRTVTSDKICILPFPPTQDGFEDVINTSG